MRPPHCRTLVMIAALAIAVTACGRKDSTMGPGTDTRVTADRPSFALSVQLERIDDTRFIARLRSVPEPGSAPIASTLYALDPPASGEPVWQALPPQGIALTLARRDSKPYTLVVKAMSAAGLVSQLERTRFTADQVVASAQIVNPRPSQQLSVPTLTSVLIEWTGTDPEAPGGVPGSYLTLLVTASQIDPGNPNGITAAQVQAYFANRLANDRAAWTEMTETEQLFDNLPPDVTHFFAVSAADVGGEPGAHDTFFDRNRNVLAFRPTLDPIGPKLTVFNSFFLRSSSTFNVQPIVDAPLAPGQTMDFNWVSEPPVGALSTGTRWCLDIEDITDETPRLDPSDTGHWSTWSLDENSATVGPFPFVPGPAGEHLFYVEARDNIGRVSMAVVRIVPQGYQPGADLLVVDDLYGTATTLPVQFVGAYPMEAEQDSFYFAVGGFPDEFRRQAEGNPSALSEPGVFSGYECDTLDYRFWPAIGIAAPYKYRAVAWYTDNASAARSGSRFSSFFPQTALREINSVNRINTLASYVHAGGKLWLFGEGATPAIANGYWSRIASGVPAIPYTSGDDPLHDVLVPGNFLYDFCHLRSELNLAGTGNAFARNQELQSAIPYLPEFKCADGTIPPVSGRTCDPRIGPGAFATQVRWSGLPQLTLRAYRGATANPLERSISRTWVITQPLYITEGIGDVPVADTLYICAARTYDPEHTFVPPSDGFPNAIHYHGSAHGEVVWMGFPLHFSELDQARQVARKVLEVFGIDPLPAGVKRGPGSAHDLSNPLVAGGGGDEDPILRRSGRP